MQPRIRTAMAGYIERQIRP